MMEIERGTRLMAHFKHEEILSSAQAQVFFDEMVQNGGAYVPFSTSSVWPTSNVKYIYWLSTNSLGGNLTRVE